MLRDSLEVSGIILRWEKEMRIDVRSEFKEISAIDFYECCDCAVRFFKPDVAAGSSALYEKLEKLDTYYMPEKWEHHAALQDMGNASNGIEIGCGFGAFVARVIREKGIAFEGCEQNASAVRVAQSNGTPVRLETLGEVLRRSEGGYDAVCAFQVLEHVADPKGFLHSASRLLRPGGKLILGLPNADSFIKHLPSLYQQPPHHMTRWNAKVLTRLSNWFPLQLVRIAYEPLQKYQVEWYVEAYERVLRRLGLGSLVHPWIRSRTTRLIRDSGVRKLLKGETLYASYVRT